VPDSGRNGSTESKDYREDEEAGNYKNFLNLVKIKFNLFGKTYLCTLKVVSIIVPASLPVMSG